jgi:hypothetical protein
MAAGTGNLTQVQAARLATNEVDRVITMAIVKASSVLEDVVFKTTGSRHYRFYRAVDSLPQHKWSNYNVSHTVVRGDIEQQDAEMFVLGAQIRIDDKYLRDKLVESPLALNIKMLAEALGHKYADAFFNGWMKDEGLDTSNNPVKSFPGLAYRTNNPSDFGLAPTCKIDCQVVAGGTAGDNTTVDITLATAGTKAQKFIFAGFDYPCSLIDQGNLQGVACYAPRDVWVVLPYLTRLAGYFATTKDSFDRDVPTYRGVPIRDAGMTAPGRDFTINRVLGREATDGSLSATSGVAVSQYFVKHGTDNLFGIQQFGIENKDLGIDPTNGVFRNFISQWPNGLVNRRPWDVVRVFDIYRGTANAL